MSIIKADFDWISLLVIVGAGVISMVKSMAKKTPANPMKTPHTYTPEVSEDEKVEWYVDTDYYKTETIQPIEKDILSSDYYKQPEQETDIRNTISSIEIQETEEEQENVFQLDIRQAIIGGEILRRPEY